MFSQDSIILLESEPQTFMDSEFSLVRSVSKLLKSLYNYLLKALAAQMF